MRCSHLSSAPGRRGAALLEVSCALFIVTVGLFGVLQMYTSALNHTRYLLESDLAQNILENEVETLHGAGFDALNVGTTSAFHTESEALRRLHDAHTRVTVAPTAGAERFAKTITLTVTWTGRTGRTITRSISTIVADRGNVGRERHADAQ